MQNMVSFFFPDLSSQLSVAGRWKLLLKIYGAAPSAKRQAALSHRVCMARVRQHISQRRLRPITLVRPVQRQLELQGECPLHVGCRRWPAACRAPARKHGAAARSVQAARRRRKSAISAPNARPPRPPAPPSHAGSQRLRGLEFPAGGVRCHAVRAHPCRTVLCHSGQPFARTSMQRRSASGTSTDSTFMSASSTGAPLAQHALYGHAPKCCTRKLVGDRRGSTRRVTTCLDAAACESLLSDLDQASRALLLSQAGPGGSGTFTVLPTTSEFRMPSDRMRVLLLKRCACRCPLGDWASFCLQKAIACWILCELFVIDLRSVVQRRNCEAACPPSRLERPAWAAKQAPNKGHCQRPPVLEWGPGRG